MEQGHWDAVGSSRGKLEAAAAHVDGSRRQKKWHLSPSNDGDSEVGVTCFPLDKVRILIYTHTLL
jgi:hypothetical protein